MGNSIQPSSGFGPLIGPQRKPPVFTPPTPSEPSELPISKASKSIADALAQGKPTALTRSAYTPLKPSDPSPLMTNETRQLESIKAAMPRAQPTSTNKPLTRPELRQAAELKKAQRGLRPGYDVKALKRGEGERAQKEKVKILGRIIKFAQSIGLKSKLFSIKKQ